MLSRHIFIAQQTKHGELLLQSFSRFELRQLCFSKIANLGKCGAAEGAQTAGLCWGLSLALSIELCRFCRDWDKIRLDGCNISRNRSAQGASSMLQICCHSVKATVCDPTSARLVGGFLLRVL